MGSYFEDVYLKRINLDGNTQQDRIKTRKEKEFNNLFLKKSEYQCLLYEINDAPAQEICSLQPNKWNESNLIGNLLMKTESKKLQTGDIIKIKQKIKDVEQDKIWIVLFVEENLTKGYQLFKIICLDNFVNLTDEYGTTENSFPAKFITASTALVMDTFVHSKSQMGYREPQANRCFITKDFDFLKKGHYFEYKGRGWEIAGIDNISINGVAYVTFSERLYRPEEPVSSKDILVGKDNNFFLNGR